MAGDWLDVFPTTVDVAVQVTVDTCTVAAGSERPRPRHRRVAVQATATRQDIGVGDASAEVRSRGTQQHWNFWKGTLPDCRPACTWPTSSRPSQKPPGSPLQSSPPGCWWGEIQYHTRGDPDAAVVLHSRRYCSECGWFGGYETGIKYPSRRCGPSSSRCLGLRRR